MKTRISSKKTKSKKSKKIKLTLTVKDMVYLVKKQNTLLKLLSDNLFVLNNTIKDGLEQIDDTLKDKLHDISHNDSFSVHIRNDSPIAVSDISRY